MYLISPYGVRVSVSDEYGEDLLDSGLGYSHPDGGSDKPADDAKKTPARKPNNDK